MLSVITDHECSQVARSLQNHDKVYQNKWLSLNPSFDRGAKVLRACVEDTIPFINILYIIYI